MGFVHRITIGYRQSMAASTKKFPRYTGVLLTSGITKRKVNGRKVSWIQLRNMLIVGIAEQTVRGRKCDVFSSGLSTHLIYRGQRWTKLLDSTKYSRCDKSCDTGTTSANNWSLFSSESGVRPSWSRHCGVALHWTMYRKNSLHLYNLYSNNRSLVRTYGIFFTPVYHVDRCLFTILTFRQWKESSHPNAGIVVLIFSHTRNCLT